MHEILTADEIANRIRVRRSTIVRWVGQGIIPAIRPSPKILRFDPEAVILALKERANEHAAEDSSPTSGECADG